MNVLTPLSIESVFNLATSLAFFFIPLLLLSLVKNTQQSIRFNLLLTILFLLSCGVGHLLAALEIHLPIWNGVTATIAWIAVGVLARSQSELKYFAKTFRLLDEIWDKSIIAHMLFQRDGNDLKLIKANPAGFHISQGILQPGDLLCEKMPNHCKSVYPYDQPLIDLYLEVLDTGEWQQREFRYDDELQAKWFFNVSIPMSKDLLYMNFLDVTLLKEASLRDYLTGLYNRRHLELNLEGWQGCLYIDLNRFQSINDLQGHHVGDSILSKVGQILEESAVAQKGIAIREGGDEFLLLLPQTEADLVAQSILQQITTLDIEGTSISASIGIATTAMPGLSDQTSFNQLQQAAESAAREAKKNQHSDSPNHRIRHWDSQIALVQSRQFIIETNLRKPNLEEELSLVYQPIYNLSSQKIVGAEALLRWECIHLGNVSPGEFIPIAENTGLISRLSKWVIQTALQQLSFWYRISSEFWLSINISPMELEEENFPERIYQQMKQAGVPGQSVGIEVTERGIYQNLKRYSETLRKLQNMQVRLKVDDFGTGQSGLAQLLNFQFDSIKVDRSFMPSSVKDQGKLSICAAITAISKSLKFDLIAEGIETQTQMDLLRSLGYQLGQGYYLAKPMSAKSLSQLLKLDNKLEK